MYDVQAKKINTLIRCVCLGVVGEGGGGRVCEAVSNSSWPVG